MRHITVIGFNTFNINFWAESFHSQDNHPTTIRLENIVKISPSCFRSSGEIEIIAPNVTVIGPGAFMDSALISAHVPKCKNIGQYAFNGTTLVDISLPAIETIGMSAFGSSNDLSAVNLGTNPNGIHKTLSLEEAAFESCCYRLTNLDFSGYECAQIPDRCFSTLELPRYVLPIDDRCWQVCVQWIKMQASST